MYSKETDALTQLKNALLSINGAFLKLGITPDATTICIPDSDWNYIHRVMVSGVSPAASKLFKPVDASEFSLSGIRVKKYRQGENNGVE